MDQEAIYLTSLFVVANYPQAQLGLKELLVEIWG